MNKSVTSEELSLFDIVLLTLEGDTRRVIQAVVIDRFESGVAVYMQKTHSVVHALVDELLLENQSVHFVKFKDCTIQIIGQLSLEEALTHSQRNIRQKALELQERQLAVV